MSAKWALASQRQKDQTAPCIPDLILPYNMCIWSSLGLSMLKVPQNLDVCKHVFLWKALPSWCCYLCFTDDPMLKLRTISGLLLEDQFCFLSMFKNWPVICDLKTSPIYWKDQWLWLLIPTTQAYWLCDSGWTTKPSETLFSSMNGANSLLRESGSLSEQLLVRCSLRG